jgi:hypothetical protein
MHAQGLLSQIFGVGVDGKRVRCLEWLGAGVLTALVPNRKVTRSLSSKIAGLAVECDVLVLAWASVL